MRVERYSAESRIYECMSAIELPIFIVDRGCRIDNVDD